MYFGLDLKLLFCQYLLTKYVNKNLLQKFEIRIGCLYEVNEILDFTSQNSMWKSKKLLRLFSI